MNTNTNDTRTLRIISILFFLYVTTFVEGLVLTWIFNALGFGYDHVIVEAEYILAGAVRYGLLIAVAAHLPQLWAKIPAIIILAIMYINTIFARLGGWNLYDLFSKPLKFNYFEF